MKRLATLFAVLAFDASAHVTLEVRQAPADSNYKAVLRVGHGCKDSPTVRLRVRIPEGVTGVKPQPKAGWKLDITRSGENVSEVAWSGGSLPDEHYDEFALRVRLPDKPGATLYFPVVQECRQGVHRWIELPAAGQSADDLKEPAPALRLTPKQ
jgi:uncharacterized protein YcnI